MKVKLKKIKKEEIRLGDIFVSDEDNSYILVYFNGKYALINMESANTHWQADVDYDDLVKRIQKNMLDGILTHYPKGLYHLTLSKGN